MGLGDGGDRERHREEEDVVDVGGVQETIESRRGEPEEGTDEEHLERHRHPQPELDDLAPLLALAGIAEDPPTQLPGGVEPGRLE